MSKVQLRGCGIGQPCTMLQPLNGTQPMLGTVRISGRRSRVIDEETDAGPKVAKGINSRAGKIPELGPHPSTLS